MTPWDPNKTLADYEAEAEAELAKHKGQAQVMHRILFVATRPVSKKDRIDRIKAICQEALGA